MNSKKKSSPYSSQRKGRGVRTVWLKMPPPPPPPHTIVGDDKHLTIKAPEDYRAVYHKYKIFFFIILLALLDSDYKIYGVVLELMNLLATVLSSMCLL